MNDAHATHSVSERPRKETGQQFAGLLAVEPMQVDLVLDHPAPAPQVAQYAVGEAGAQVARFVAAFEPILKRDWPVQAFVQRRPLVGQVLQRAWRRHRAAEMDAIRRRQWPGIRHCRPKGREIVRVDQSCFTAQARPSR